MVHLGFEPITSNKSKTTFAIILKASLMLKGLKYLRTQAHTYKFVYTLFAHVVRRLPTLAEVVGTS